MDVSRHVFPRHTVYASFVHCFYPVTKLKCHSFLMFSTLEEYLFPNASCQGDFIYLTVKAFSPISFSSITFPSSTLLPFYSWYFSRVQSHVAWHLFIMRLLQFISSVCFGFVHFQGLGPVKNDNKASCSNRDILGNTSFSFTLHLQMIYHME